MQTSVKFDTKKAQEVLKRIIEGTNDFTPALKEVATYQEKQVQEAFETGGKNITGGWPKLKASTLKQKLRSGFQSQILVRRGILRKSFSVSEINKNSLKIGSKGTNYFQYHQTGTGKMPQRQILGHSESMIKKALDIVADYFIKLIKRG